MRLDAAMTLVEARVNDLVGFFRTVGHAANDQVFRFDQQILGIHEDLVLLDACFAPHDLGAVAFENVDRIVHQRQHAEISQA